MDWIKEISAQIVVAMKAKDKVTLEALRGIKKELLEAKSAKGNDGEVSPELGLAILSKMLKQRNESAEIYKTQGREDMMEVELAEAAVISKFLPAKLSTEEIKEEIKAIIAETGASSIKEMGKVMGIASKKLTGRADGKEISAIVKELLA